ncbi:tyrosine-type recombinase/integrase [Candidatus Calescamantes bacterium]|nr:tyrosine-type recombinase/integrase [Candidatus Calescamantes bacterium]
MGVFKKGKNWYIDYYYQGRRIREKVGPSKSLAELALKKRKIEIAEGKFLDKRKKERIRFRDFAKEFLEVYSKPNKRSWKRDEISIKHLSKFFGGKYLSEITPYDIENYKKERIQKVSPSTVNRELTCLKTIFNKAIQWEKIDGNPVRKVRLYKENNQRVRYLTQEEIRKLINNAQEPLKSIIILALNTGMRQGEIMNLKWQDIDLENRVIYVKETKSGEKREVPINKVLDRKLR